MMQHRISLWHVELSNWRELEKLITLEKNYRALGKIPMVILVDKKNQYNIGDLERVLGSEEDNKRYPERNFPETDLDFPERDLVVNVYGASVKYKPRYFFGSEIKELYVIEAELVKD